MIFLISATWVAKITGLATGNRLVIFQVGTHIYACIGLDCNPPTCTSCVPEMTGLFHHIQPLVKIGSWKHFAQAGLELWSSQSPPRITDSHYI
jgi:hypothetical protein